MPQEDALLNIDISITNKPELIGNRYVTQDFVSSSDVKTNLNKYMDIEEIIKKLNFKNRYVGQMTNTTNQVLPFYQRLIDKSILKPNKFSFVSIGAHHNLYSYDGYSEFETKKEIHNYEAYQAFVYLFLKKYIDKMIWVHPDYYTEEDVDKHFKCMDFVKRNGYHIVSINQGLRFVVKPIKWSLFLPSKYNWKNISLIANKLTTNFKPDDLRKLKNIIF